MKVAVYGVAKNEESNIINWYQSSKDADYHLILDTGSTDNTISLAKSLGINVVSASFIPWDETLAKNVALSLLPSDIDYCIMLDLDQKIKTKNWKEVLTSNNIDGYEIIEHYSVDYVDEINSDMNRFNIRSIHSRKNTYWHKYRPRLESYSEIPKSMFLDIEIENVAGNEERFSHREELYLNAWEREYIRFKKNYPEKQTQYFLEIISHQAFNFYEQDLFEKYLLKYKEFINIYNSLDEYGKKDAVLLYSTFILANSLYYTESARQILKLMPEDSPMKTNADFKLMIIDFWENGNANGILNHYNDEEIISLYADTKTGKYKINLARQAKLHYSK